MNLTKLLLFLFLFFFSTNAQFSDNDFTQECTEASPNGLYCQKWTLTPEGTSCFPGDAYVFNTNYERIPIRDLKYGDMVMTVDPNNQD